MTYQQGPIERKADDDQTYCGCQGKKKTILKWFRCTSAGQLDEGCHGGKNILY